MFGVFVIISFIFLVLTKFSKIYTEDITLNISYENIPEDIAITLDKPKKLNVVVSAVGFRILLYYFKDRKIILNLEQDVVQNDSSFIYEPMITDKAIKDKIGYAVEILSVKPDSLVIPYSVLDSKLVPIKLNSNVTLASGYDFVDSLQAQPDSVKIIGPSKVLKAINYIETQVYKKENTSVNSKDKVMLIRPESDQVKMSRKETNVILNVNKFTEGTLQVPVKIVNLPPKVKINYFPKTVPVSFYVNLKNYSEVKVEDFLVECDYNEVKDTRKSFFTPRLTEYPEFVKTAKIRLDKIEFILTK